jgi:hypothetical protein
LLAGALGAVASFSGQAQVRQVDGQMILGQSGSASGALTLMPPDGTGWYHIDNPGGQQVRISGGTRPGQFLYVTVSHPGRVTVHGDLVVTGALQAKSLVGAPKSPGGGRGKFDAATPGDVEMLSQKIDDLSARINQLNARINQLERQRNP